jgi:hypothetical protein
MDSKDLSLYLEEQRLELIKLNKGILELSDKLQTQVETYVAPKEEINVKGEVTVNTQKEVTVKNLNDLQDWLKNASQAITKAISDNKTEPIKEINVKNIKDAKNEAIKITNFSELQKFFDGLNKAINDLPAPIVNVEKQTIELPTAANKAIAVRLSDGKSFYNAITSFTNAVTNIDTESIVTELQTINSLTPNSFDYIAVTYPTTDSEVYTYKKGGSGGTTMQTITVTYASATKDQIISVART